MIHKLKQKYTMLVTVFMLILMSVLMAIMNIINYSSVVSESDTVLDVLTQPNAPFFEKKELPDANIPDENMKDFIPFGMSPEVPYESRFFSVTVSSNGSVLESDFSKILSVNETTVKSYVQSAIGSHRERGFVGQFRFAKAESDKGTTILFLDCGRKLDAFYTFLWTSLGVGFLGCILVFVAFLFAADKIVKPIADSYEKQKRFISDAGHEIKTPLTIITANIDLLEADLGENEGFDDIRSQTKRLSKLTNDLVYLSKMEETESKLAKIEFPFSDLVSETVAPFGAVAAFGKKKLHVQVVPNLAMNGAPDAIQQLVSILMENAMKYSPEGGTVSVKLTSSKKALLFSVSNTLISHMDSEQCSRVFDRFYRTDASRNSETGGHGIGLSIAQAITEAHGGKITASASDSDFTVNVSFPLYIQRSE